MFEFLFQLVTVTAGIGIKQICFAKNIYIILPLQNFFDKYLKAINLTEMFRNTSSP